MESLTEGNLDGPLDPMSDQAPDSAPLNALRRAVRDGSLDTCAQLLGQHPELARGRSTRGGSLLLEAFEREHVEIAALFRTLVDAGASTMVGLDVHEAAAFGAPAALQHALTEDMLCLEELGPAGFAPLHRAAYRGRADVTRLLLEAGADPNQRSGNGARLTPLHSIVAGARRFGASDAYRTAAATLIEAGADLDIEMEGGWTARATSSEAGLGALDALDAPHDPDVAPVVAPDVIPVTTPEQRDEAQQALSAADTGLPQ